LPRIFFSRSRYDLHFAKGSFILIFTSFELGKSTNRAILAANYRKLNLLRIISMLAEITPRHAGKCHFAQAAAQKKSRKQGEK
jgi:hypothetical protein